MDIELRSKAQELLESLANSIHDRSSDVSQFCFSIAEIHIVEEWVRNILIEIEKPECGET